MSLYYLFDYLDRYVVVSLFPYLERDWGLTDTQCGMLTSAVYWSIVVFSLPASVLVDRWSRSKCIGCMALVWSLSTAACAFTRSFSQLFAARTLVGIGEAGYAPGGTAMISALFPERKRSIFVGIWNMSIPLGSALGIAIGGIVATHFGWRHAFGLVAVPGMLRTMGFENRVVVVTGAASGIGAAICRRFGQAGARIVLADLDEEGLAARGRELSASGVEALWVRCDVTSEEDCRSAIDRALDRFGGIDVLVNNAGITQRGAFVETQIPVFRRVMEVNFFGSLYCTKAAIPSLVERRGLIIVIESVAGLTPLYGRTGYCASKMALHGLFTSLRTEVRSLGVHVMIVCPGFVRTHLQSRALGGDGTVTQRPQSRVGREESPEAVAEAVFRGALARRHLVITTPVGKLAHWMNRWSPPAYERLMAWALRSELER